MKTGTVSLTLPPAATAMIAEAHDDRDDLDRYGEPVVKATKGQVLFGLAENQGRLSAGATPVRVEGVFDALAVTLAGDGAAVGLAPLGTALTVAQADELVRVARDQPILYGTDNDAAGTKAAHRDYMMLAARGIDVRRLVLTDGQRTFNDPADAYTADHGIVLHSVLAAVDVAPPLASQLIGRPCYP